MLCMDKILLGAILLMSAAEGVEYITDNHKSSSTIKSKENSTQIVYDRSASTLEVRRAKCNTESPLDLKFNSEWEKAKCCSEIVKTFRSDWVRVLYHITDYLRVLKTFQCPQFSGECANHTYDFTHFTRLTYDRFCDSKEFYEKCGFHINKTLLKYNISGTIRKDQMHLHTTEANFVDPGLYILQNISLALDDILEPCIQASLINTEENIQGGFYEMKELQAPFCDIIWCGFPGYAFEKYEISEWSCMLKRCRSTIYVLMTVCGLLAVISVVVNTVSLIIFKKTRRLRDSQGIYKISLAVTDLLIGLVVFPSAIETIRRTYMPATELLRPEDNGNFYLKIYSFSTPYHNFVGFFTILTNFVSIFTLMIASLDRFMVVFRPLRYNLYTAKTWAVKLSIGVWIVGILLSIVPIAHPDLKYQMIAGFLESISGNNEIIILGVLFVLPLVIVVATHIATIVYSKKNARARPKPIANGKKIKDMSVERRLARTLGIMVGSFLLCVLPLGILILVHIFLIEINYHNPELLNVTTVVTLTSLEYTLCVVFLSNSVWNFVIYNARSAEFRDATRKYFIKLKMKVLLKFEFSTTDEQRRKPSAALSSTQIPYNNTASTGLNI